jgi:hypothetical protein
MGEGLTYKDRLRRTELICLHKEFLGQMDHWRDFTGIPRGGFFCMQRAMHWDWCQKREPVHRGGRPKGWVPSGFYPDEPWGMPKSERERLKWAWMPGGEERPTGTRKGPWPNPPGWPTPPPPGEDLLSQVVEGIIYNWSLSPTAADGIRWYLLTGYDWDLSRAASPYQFEAECDPMRGTTVTIRGLHPYLTEAEKERLWDDIRWKLMYYVLAYPGLCGEQEFHVKQRPAQERDFFMYRKVEFEGVPFSEALDEWLALYDEPRDSDFSEAAVRKSFERLREEIKAMRPKE